MKTVAGTTVLFGLAGFASALCDVIQPAAALVDFSESELLAIADGYATEIEILDTKDEEDIVLVPKPLAVTND